MIASITASITTLMFDVLVAVVKWGATCFPLLLLHARNWVLMNSLAASTSWSGPEETEGMHLAVVGTCWNTLGWNMLERVGLESCWNMLDWNMLERVGLEHVGTCWIGTCWNVLGWNMLEHVGLEHVGTCWAGTCWNTLGWNMLS